MVVWRGVQGGCGLFFQTNSKTHSDRLAVVDSSHTLLGGGACLVIGNLFHTFPH